MPRQDSARSRTKAFRLGWLQIGLVAVLAATFFLYTPAISYQFVYDDNSQIANNPHLQSWSFLPVYFMHGVWSQNVDTQTNLYRPLFLVWLRLNTVFFGQEPWAWHLTTLLMHVLVTWLVYRLSRKLLQHRSAALLAAALFGFHPIHIEGVAWISGVAEPLGATFLLLAFLCYLKQRNDADKRLLWSALSLLLFGAGVLVKETEAVLPLLIALYEVTLGRPLRSDPLERTSLERPPSESVPLESIPGRAAPNWRSVNHWSGRLLPYFGVLVVYLVLRSNAIHLSLRPGETSSKTALLSLPWLVWLYIKMLLWPTNLSPLYDFPYVHDAASPRFLVPLLALVVVAGLLWWRRKRISALVMFLVGWFLITLAPALAQFRLANGQESYHDRYLYLPSFALVVLVAAAFQYLYSKQTRATQYLAWGVAVLLLGASIAGTWRQLPYWNDNYALYQRATVIAPQNERAAGNFAGELIDHRELQRAIQISQRMMVLYPHSELPLRPAAMAALQMQDFALAENYYTRLVEMEPEESGLLFLLGISRIRLSDYEGALAPLRKATALSPGHPFHHYTLGLALAKLGRWQEARDQYAAELAVNDQDPATRRALAEAESHSSLPSNP